MIAGLAVVVGMVYGNEARKEVVYLCGNFGVGIAEERVISVMHSPCSPCAKPSGKGHVVKELLSFKPAAS